jgi:hypothetical protein
VGLRDTLFGRTKQVAPNLDQLFSLPQGAITLEAQLDLVPSGHAGLCFKGGTGQSEVSTDDEIKDFLNLDAAKSDFSITTDDLGFKWILLQDDDLGELVTRIHTINTSLIDHELGPRLLCAVFGFVPKTPPGEGSVRLVYLFKRGTFYPFAQSGPQQRNNELEIRVRTFLGADLPVEKDLARWMALWDVPVA